MVVSARSTDLAGVPSIVRRASGLLWALAGVALLSGLAMVPLILPSRQLTHPPWLWVAVAVGVGWAFAAAGLWTWRQRPDSRVGALMYATGLAWFVGQLNCANDPRLYTLGLATGSLFAATAVHLLLAFPSGRLATPAERALVVLGYVLTTVATVPVLLFLDPVSPACPTCPANVLLVAPNARVAEAISEAVQAVTGIVLVGVLTVLVSRWRRASPPQRRLIGPLYLTGVVMLAVFALLLAARVVDLPLPIQSVIADVGVAPIAGVTVLPLIGLVVRRLSRGQAVNRFVAGVGRATGAGELRTALAEALGDPALELVYWLPEKDRYVNAEGRLLDLGEDSRVVSEVQLDGRRVGAFIHDPALLADAALVEAAGAAAALAIDRDRLQAELRARVQELHESRARVIGVGMAERRRLERDLHDGAQQRLVSLALTLGVARETIAEDPGGTGRLLDSAAAELRATLAELRELARGIHPVVLSERGLSTAVQALVGRAPLPVEFVHADDLTVPEPVALAAYFVVAEALTNVAKYAGASAATVRAAREDGRLTVEIHDDGVGGADPERGSGLRGLADRLSALDGQLEIDSTPGRGTTVRARIPVAER